MHMQVLQAEVNPLTMAVVGLAGEGKSTLINSLLHLDPECPAAAKTGDDGFTVTTDVRCYSRIKDGTVLNIWDIPPLGDADHVDPKKVIQALRERAGEVDLYLFCIKYYRGMRVNDEHRNIIQLLTREFGKAFWKKVCFVMTMVNIVRDPKTISISQNNILRELLKLLRNAGVPEDVVRDKQLLLAGIGEELIQVNDGEYEDWNSKLFLHCVSAVADERKKNNTKRSLFSWF